MANLQNVQQMMTELGPYDDRIGLIQQQGDDLWLVVYNDDTAIEIECDEPGNKLTFSMVIGPVAEDGRLEIYEAMLAYNYLHRDTGGMRMAIEGTEGNVVLLVDLCHLDLEAGTLAGFLGVVVETGLGWREALGGGEAVLSTGADDVDISGAIQA